MSTTVVPASRGSVDPRPVAPETLSQVVEEALHAFTSDVSYAVALARAAGAINGKRDKTA